MFVILFFVLGLLTSTCCGAIGWTRPLHTKLFSVAEPVAWRSSNSSMSLSRSAFINAGAGAISCSFTHSIMVPLDVIKTHMQASQALLHGVKLSSLEVARNLIASNGWLALSQGLSATFTGYFLQGAFKFGFYDFFKLKASEYSKSYGDVLKINRGGKEVAERVQSSYKLNIPTLLLCSAMAEVIASFVLCPLEGTKIYMMMNPQTSKEGLLRCIKTIVKQGGIVGLYAGLPWILLRQVPYTCMKLVGYDTVLQFVQSKLDNLGGNYSKLSLQMFSGVVAGVLAAIVSQPADVILSQVCSRNPASTQCLSVNSPKSFLKLVQSIGFQRSFTGLQQRVVMVAGMTALQFVVFENVKLKMKEAVGNP